jgi:hypothetical protein
MRHKDKFKHFEFPESLIKQINECTRGFVLFTVNDQNKFEVFQNMSDPVTAFGMTNFIESVSNQMQCQLREEV